MIKEANSKNKEDWGTTPALVVLIVLHVILITTIFVIHARRREKQEKPVTEHTQSSPSPMTHSEFLAQRESLLKTKIESQPKELQEFQELVSVYRSEGRCFS